MMYALEDGSAKTLSLFVNVLHLKEIYHVVIMETSFAG